MCRLLLSPSRGLCNGKVDRAFQPDPGSPASLKVGNGSQPGKANLQLRCKAVPCLLVEDELLGIDQRPEDVLVSGFFVLGVPGEVCQRRLELAWRRLVRERP